MPLNPTIAKVTDRIIERSKASRTTYLERIDRAIEAARDGRDNIDVEEQSDS